MRGKATVNQDELMRLSDAIERCSETTGRAFDMNVMAADANDGRNDPWGDPKIVPPTEVERATTLGLEGVIAYLAPELAKTVHEDAIADAAAGTEWDAADEYRELVRRHTAIEYETEEYEWLFSRKWGNADPTAEGTALRIRDFVKHGLPEDRYQQLDGEAPLSYRKRTESAEKGPRADERLIAIMVERGARKRLKPWAALMWGVGAVVLGGLISELLKG